MEGDCSRWLTICTAALEKRRSETDELFNTFVDSAEFEKLSEYLRKLKNSQRQSDK